MFPAVHQVKPVPGGRISRGCERSGSERSSSRASFGSRLPSTNWVLQNALRILDNDTIDHSFARRERWVREGVRLAAVGSGGLPIGTWRSMDEDDPIRITVTRTNEKREHTLRLNADGSLDHIFAEHAMLVRVR
jgi:hypothetical protein